MTLIAVPLAAELRVIRAVLAETARPVAKPTDRASGPEIEVFPDLGIGLLRGGHGKAEFAARCAWVLARNHEIQRLIVAGTAGALSPRLNPGDIVVATEVIEHDYSELFDPHARLPRFTTDPELMKLLAVAADVHRGIIAGGDEDIVTTERAQQLAEATGAIAVAWESPGGARAASTAGVPWCEVRGISDGADANAASDFKRQLSGTMTGVGRLILSWIGQSTADS